MEEKILTTLQELKGQFEKKLEEMNQKFEKKFDEMDEKFERKFDDLKEENRKLCQEMENLHEEVREIRDQQFVFEEEYGKKIDAIFDAVTLELDKNLEKSKKIRKLDERMERSEIVIFDHEKRISKVELKK